MLPRLAINGGWLRLIDEVHCEQKSRQVAVEIPESEQQRAYKERKAAARNTGRKRARKHAMAGRGAIGLWKKIKGIA